MHNLPETIDNEIRIQACSLEERTNCSIYQRETKAIAQYISDNGVHPSNLYMICTSPQRILRGCPKVANIEFDTESYTLYYSNRIIGIDYEKINSPYPDIESINNGLKELGFYNNEEIEEQLDKIRPLTWIFKLGIKCHQNDSCSGIVDSETHICESCGSNYEQVMQNRKEHIELLGKQFDE